MTFANVYERLFYEALRIRLVEERIRGLCAAARLPGRLRLSIGEEAVAVGTCAALGPTDRVFASSLERAFYLAKGGDLRALMLALYGKSGGGTPGPTCPPAPEVGFMASSAAFAGALPHAVGAALATRRLGHAHLAMAVLDDEATGRGVYHETLSFAALHRLPVVFLWVSGTVHARRAVGASYRVDAHAASYGIPVATCDEGGNFLAVHAVVCRVVEAVRRDGGPWLVQCRICRYGEPVAAGADPHAGSRRCAEIEAWRARDPLLQDGAVGARWRPVIARELDEAVAFAEASPWPGAGPRLTDAT